MKIGTRAGFVIVFLGINSALWNIGLVMEVSLLWRIIPAAIIGFGCGFLIEEYRKQEKKESSKSTLEQIVKKAEKGGLPEYAITVLTRGYDGRHPTDLSDRQLLNLPGLGLKTLEDIRKVFPYRGDQEK